MTEGSAGGIAAKSEAGIPARMTEKTVCREHQSVANRLTMNLMSMRLIESLPKLLFDMLELEKK
ncbi:MAG: hypothetical protein F4X92_10495 [Gammaproteobacteria bacterium]|nr:hypothetical protein [Gammaproteobacteria bacterium]